MSSALEEAEAYVASLESAPCPLLTLAAMHTRFQEALESREEAVQTLERKRKQYQASLQSVKLVSARMIQCVGSLAHPRARRARTFSIAASAHLAHVFSPLLQGEGGLHPQPL